MATLPGLRTSLTLDSAAFDAGVRSVTSSVDRLGRQVAQQNAAMQRSFGAVTGAANLVKSAIIGLVGAFSVDAIVRLGKGALDAAGGLGEMAQQAGVTISQLQILSLAGVQTGVTQQQLITSLAQFGKRVGEAAQGTGGLIKTLEQYNISVRNATGNTRASYDVLGDLAEAVKNAGSAQEQLRIAQAALGREGAKLVPILAQGREGLAAIAEQARAAGLVMDDELVKQADRASDAIGSLQFAASQGFQTGVVKAFGDAVSLSTDALKRAREAGELFGKGVGAAIKLVADVARFVAEHFEAVRAALTALVAIKAAAFFYEIAGAARTAAIALGLFNVAALGPWGLIAAAIGAATVAVIGYHSEIEQLTGINFGDFGTAVARAATEAWEGLRKELSGIVAIIAAILNADWSAAAAAAQQFGEGLQQFALSGAKGLETFQEESRKTAAATADDLAAATATANALERLGSSAQTAAGQLGLAADASEEIASKLGEAITKASNEAAQLNALKDAYAGVGASVEQVQRAIKIQQVLDREGVTLEQAKESGLLKLVDANIRNAASIDEVAAATKRNQAATEQSLRAQQDLLERAKADVADLTRIREALSSASGAGEVSSGVSSISIENYRNALQAAEDLVAVEKELRAVGLSRQEAERRGILQVIELRQQQIRQNQEIQSSLEARGGFAEEAAQLQLLIDARGQETEELRVQLTLLDVKQRLGADAAASVEGEVRAVERLRSELEASNAARSLADTIEEQQLLLRFAGQETEEYRVQLQLLQFKRAQGGEITAAQEAQVRQIQRQTTEIKKLQDQQTQQAAATASLLAEPFKNALRSIQGTFESTFETIYSGGVTTFGDLAETVKQIFVRLAAQITTLLIFQPQLVGGIAGIGGAAAGAAGAAGAAAPALATQLSPAATAAAAGQPIPLFAGPGEAATAVAGGTQAALNPAGVAQVGFWTRAQAMLPQLLLAGGLGFVGGSLAGGLFGGKGQLGGGIGGAAGAVGGAALGSIIPGVGTALGGVIGGVGGGLLGGALGGLFGGGEDINEVTIGRRLGKTGGTSAAAQFVETLDRQIMDLLTQEQIKQANKFIDDVTVEYDKILDEGAKKAIAKERIGAAAQALGFRPGAIKGAGGPEEQLAALQRAIATQEAIQDLTSGMGDFEREAVAITERFAGLRAAAKEFGISTTGLAKAQKEAGLKFVAQQLQQLTGLTPTFAQQMKDLKESFKDLKAAAKELGLSTRDVERAQKQATAALKEQQKQLVDQMALSAIEPFEQLRSPLQAFQTQLSFAGMNPLQQLQAAQADFDRIAALAQAGNTDAIQQLTEAADLFIRLSEQVGASPGAAAAREQVTAVIDQVLANINKAQADASKGLETAIKSASKAEIDTLKELIQASRDIAEEIKRLRRAS